MDLADSINALSEHMKVSFWRIAGIVACPDLGEFRRQDTNMSLFPVEFVKQKGDSDYGFSGEIYFPTTYKNGDGGVLYLHVEFSD